MKTKRTVPAGQRVVSKGKPRARAKRTTVARGIQQGPDVAIASGTPTFSARWRGRFKPEQRTGKRYQLLAKKCL